MALSKKNKVAIPLNKGIFARKYKIIEKTGQGQLSVVYRAININLGQSVAIKFPRFLTANPQESKDFVLEGARLLARLNHPHIAKVFDADEERGIPYVVMELVEGEPLKQLVAREKALSMKQGLSIGLALADALEYAHGQDVVHRDIRPANVLVGQDSKPFLVGFDLAALSSNPFPSKIDQISPQHLPFLSPEFITHGRGDHLSDIWSLGCTLFFALSGKVPFRGEDPEDVLSKINDLSYYPLDEAPSALSPKLKEILGKMMARDPSERFHSMKEVKEALRRVESSFFSKKATELIVDSWSDPFQLNRILTSSKGDIYEIVAAKGRGTFGMVYQALDKQLGRMVALKILRTEYLHNKEVVLRFQREAQAVSMIRHPNVVEIYSVGELEGIPFFVMPFIGEQDIEGLLEKEVRLTLFQSLRLGYYISLGLQAAHQAGVIHRDLKPANILLTEENIPIITDFGVAYLTTNKRLTQEVTLMGTLLYVAPEQANSTEVDGRSDLYSLGVILFEMLSGTPPFLDDTPVGLIQKIISEPPPSFESLGVSLPPEVEDFVNRLLKKKPERRYKNAQEVSLVLKDFLKTFPEKEWQF